MLSDLRIGWPGFCGAYCDQEDCSLVNGAFALVVLVAPADDGYMATATSLTC